MQHDASVVYPCATRTAATSAGRPTRWCASSTVRDHDAWSSATRRPATRRRPWSPTVSCSSWADTSYSGDRGSMSRARQRLRRDPLRGSRGTAMAARSTRRASA
jgi:hypothetical protein